MCKWTPLPLKVHTMTILIKIGAIPHLDYQR